MEETKKKFNINSDKSLKILSYVSFFVLCLSLIAKDYFDLASTINTLPYYTDISIDLTSANITIVTIGMFLIYALMYGGLIEILSRFVANSIIRVSFAEVKKYKFISSFKFILAIANFILALFNIMYFSLPFTFRLEPVITIVVLALTFGVMYAVIYKKYLNQKSAPVVFMSMALPLAIYFIVLAV